MYLGKQVTIPAFTTWLPNGYDNKLYEENVVFYQKQFIPKIFNHMNLIATIDEN